MAFLPNEKAQGHYSAGTRILESLNPSASSKKDHMRAVNHLKKAVEIDPNSAYSYHNLGYAWYKLAEHEHLVAMAHFQFKDIQDFETSVQDAFKNGGDAKVVKVRKFLDQSIKRSEADAIITGYFMFALEAVDRALEIQNNFPQAHNTRAMILAKLFRLDEAIEATEVALIQDPSYENARNNRERMKELRRQP